MKIPEFNLKPSKQEDGSMKEPETNQETLLNILSFAVSDTFSEEKNLGQGQTQTVSTLSGSQGRMWGRIQRKLDDATDHNKKSIEFEVAEVDFLKKAVGDANFPVNWFRWSVLIEDMLDEKHEKAGK